MTDHHRFALRAHYPLIDAVSAAPLLTAAEIHAYPIGILVSHAVMVKDVTILGICRPLAPAQPKGLDLVLSTDDGAHAAAGDFATIFTGAKGITAGF